MSHAGEIGAERGATEIVKARGKRPVRDSRYRWLQRRQHALAVALAEGNEPRSGGNPVRGERVEEGMHGRRQRHRMQRAHETDRYRINDRTVAGGDRIVEAFAIPRRTRDIDESAAL